MFESEKAAGIDWTHWRRMDELRLGDAICLFVRVSPKSALGRYISKMSSTNEFNSRQRELFERAKNIWDVAWASYHQHKLRMKTGMGGASVAMIDWLAWAKAKEFDIPGELEDLVPKPPQPPMKADAEPDRSDELNTKSRNTLLVIVAALMNELGIDAAKPSKAGTAIARLTQKLGAPVEARTIENYMNEIRSAVEARSK